MIYGQNPSKESRPVQTDADGRVLVSLQNSAGADNIVKVGAIVNPSASFSVPNSAATYAIGDLIANSATAGSVTPMEWTITRVAAGAACIVKMRMTKTGTGIVGAAFEVDIFSALPTVTNGDDGAYLPNQAANLLGTFQFGTTNMRVCSDGVACNGIAATGYPITVDLPSGSKVYGLVRSAGAYVRTAAETFTFTLEVEQE